MSTLNLNKNQSIENTTLSQNQLQLFQPMRMYCNFIQDICQPLFAATQVLNFSYQELAEDGTVVFFNSNLEVFEKTIASEQLFLAAQHVTQIFEHSGFFLHDALNLPSPTDKAHSIRSPWIQNPELGHALSYVTVDFSSGQRILQWYIFTGNAKNHATNTFFLNNLSILQNFITYFKNRMNKFLRHTKRIPLPEENRRKFINDFQNSPLLASVDPTKLSQTENVKKLEKTMEGFLATLLTENELVIVQCFYKGLTAKETAEKLKISSRTVERYFENLRKKLNCRTKYLVLIKLLKAGVLSLDD